MLTPAQIETIQELLSSNEQLSFRAIAERAGVSRRTVSQIAAGHRQTSHRQEPAWDASRYFDDNANIGRCADCGSRVVLPCIACRARRLRSYQRWDKPYQFGTVSRGQCHPLRRPA